MGLIKYFVYFIS